MRLPFAAAALGVVLLSAPAAPARASAPAAPATAGVRLVDLGTLGGNVSEAHAINDRGTVVGESQLASGATHAFLWRHGRMRDLGTLGGSDSVASAVNDRDQVVGSSLTADGSLHGFLWQDGQMRDLGSFGHGASVAVDINDRGGVLVRFGPKSAPVIWRAGSRLTKVRVAGAALVLATALDDRDRVVGRVDLAEVPPGAAGEQGFRWRRGDTTLLGTLGGFSSIATAINDRGQIVGWSLPAGSDRPHAFLWRAGAMTDLGTLNGIESFAHDVNGHTTVVGSIFRDDLSRTRAFRWRGGAMTDLGALDPTSPADTRANAINDRGQIVGTSAAAVGMHAILWQPI
jgi:probable HAF family extracellular repeat protein